MAVRLAPFFSWWRQRSRALLLGVAALALLLALVSDVSLSQLRGVYDWRQRVIVLLPGVCALPAQLPPAPMLPTLPGLPTPPEHWPTWPDWLTCGGAEALQDAHARALATFVGSYTSPAALTTALQGALRAAPQDTSSPAEITFTIKAIEAFSYDATAPSYASSQTRQPLAVSARALDAQLRRWRRQYPGASFDLIGHSLGGAVAAYWAAAIATPDLLGAIHSLITLDSPVGGLPHSVADALLVPFFGPVSQDLLTGSPATQTIAQAPTHWLAGPGELASAIVTIANLRDLVVPFLWATIPGASLAIDDYGADGSSLNHGSILTSPAALAQIAQVLSQEGMPVPGDS